MTAATAARRLRAAAPALAAAALVTAVAGQPVAPAVPASSRAAGSRLRALALAAQLPPDAKEMEKTWDGARVSADKGAKQVVDIHKISMENLKYVPLAKAQAATAKAAYDTVKQVGKEAKAILVEAAKEANVAAMEAAKDYLKEVKLEAAQRAKDVATAGVEEKKAMEVKAALAAAKASRPYQQFILRGQKLVVDYLTRAQELAAASNNLVGEGMKLAGSANHYQLMGQTVQANQMMMQAHSLYQQGAAMAKEAKGLHSTADEVNGMLPAYQLAAQAAASSAEEEANPPALTEVDIPLPY